MNDLLEPRKATHEQLRRHNRHLLLRAVYLNLADSRAALAQATGLTKPTVSNLIAELIEEGLISEGGHGPSSESGGKRPRLISFRPRARQVIGVAVDHDGVHAVLTDLSGEAAAHHRAPLDATRPLDALTGAVDGLLAQLDAPLLCIGVGVPGEVNAATGTVRDAAARGWRDLAVAPPLTERYGVPVHVAQRTELVALAQYAFGSGRVSGPRRLVTVQLGPGVEFGVTLEGGSVHYGGDLRAMLDSADVADEDPVADYLTLRFAAAHGDADAQARIATLARSLAPVIAWIVTLLRPDQLTLAGAVVDLGEPFLDRLRDAVRERLPGDGLGRDGLDGEGLDGEGLAGGRLRGDSLGGVTFSLAYAGRLGTLGAVALALQKELAIV